MTARHSEAIQGGAFERLLERSPLRTWVRERLEVRPLKAAAGAGRIERALHIACGNGGATRLIMKHFAPWRMSAVDRNEELIAEASSLRPHEPIDFSTQDPRNLRFADASFDAAFDLAELHNFADWRLGVRELRRVLKPGGLLILEEISAETFSHGAGRVFRRLTEHPYESMLTVAGLLTEIVQCGFELLHCERRNPFGLLRYCLVVARRTPTDALSSQGSRIEEST